MAKKFYPGITGIVRVNDLLYVRRKVGEGEYEIDKDHYLRNGVAVELLDFEDGRYKINYKGEDGYIYKDFVDLV